MRHPHKQKKPSKKSTYCYDMNERIDAAIQSYPSIMRDRFDVLHQMFLVNGGGYDWVNGELVDDTLIRTPSEKAEHIKYNLQMSYGSSDFDLDTKEGIKNFQEKRRKDQQFSIDFLSKEDPECLNHIFPKTIRICQYSNILHTPEDITVEYLQAACDLIKYVDENSPVIDSPELWEKSKQIIHDLVVAKLNP